ncbi:hypothetical protein [Bacillus infantis]|uniref:hypothetical protein n=1 Tax=Bacillus infantis TaxID=324767 RepID=UPI003CF1D61B
MKKKIFNFIFTTAVANTVWHFIDVYGTEYTWDMPASLLTNIFFGYWGTQVVILLVAIYLVYFLFVTVDKWHQNKLDKAVEKALQKHL